MNRMDAKIRVHIHLFPESGFFLDLGGMPVSKDPCRTHCEPSGPRVCQPLSSSPPHGQYRNLKFLRNQLRSFVILNWTGTDGNTTGADPDCCPRPHSLLLVFFFPPDAGSTSFSFHIPSRRPNVQYSSKGVTSSWPLQIASPLRRILWACALIRVVNSSLASIREIPHQNQLGLPHAKVAVLDP